MSRVLKYTTGLLGLLLITGISVFPDRAAIWIAFGAAIAIVVSAGLDLVRAVIKRQLVEGAAAGLIVSAASFLIVASLIFEGISRSWLMVSAGGAIELVALGMLGLPRYFAGTALTAAPAARPQETRAA